MRVRFVKLKGVVPSVRDAEFHVRRSARDQYGFDDSFFSARGDVVFTNLREAHRFAGAFADKARPAELHAMGLIHEIFHGVLSLYRRTVRPQIWSSMLETLEKDLGDDLELTLLAYLDEFPPPSVYRGEQTKEQFLAGTIDGVSNREWTLEELLLLYVSNQNPGYAPIHELVSDEALKIETKYLDIIATAGEMFDREPRFGPDHQTLLDMLLAPIRAAGPSLFQQLDFIRARWGLELSQIEAMLKLLLGLDLIREEGQWFLRKSHGVAGDDSLTPPKFGSDVYAEPEQFSADLDWMPRVVMMAKSTFVWLDQLSKKYRRDIHTLADIPDEELASLAARGFTALWLIGVWRRSTASRTVKQIAGNHEALASAYSLHDYEIAPELGGDAALTVFQKRAARAGIRLASDMVPNHMGLDSRWVNEHPDWFLSLPYPPYPGYRYTGVNLGSHPDVVIQIEDGYWSKTDAAVTFKRYDRRSGDTRYVYHGNDGTSMPWNDTAQLDYLRADVREAVIQTIMHVARKFPIIRFDAAMTLAKKHYQRLWFPLPGTGGAIPSRAEHAMTREKFEELFPVEFWREVVDRMAAEVPNTLLLAEAFWMMEGYFVRTLGMHRVYNSAFMNMLKKEENGNYRLTIRNILEFNPQILKRFVNFMNNPDEEPAVVQFGKEGKYFGVCVLLSTMPGLPMFGHGQVEGFGEKYGMEYSRAKWNEQPDEHLVARHEHEIFPLLKKRYLFSEVDRFYLYDFVAEGGHVDEDVFAYSNGAGAERAIVVYHNKYKETRGHVRTSVGYLSPGGSIVIKTLAEALELSRSPGVFTIFKDHISGLEYLHRNDDLIENGLWLELKAFEYRVLWELREVVHSPRRPWGMLQSELGNKGVPSMEEALVDSAYRAIHAPLFEAINEGSTKYLASRARAILAGEEDPEEVEPKDALNAAVEEKLTHMFDGLTWMTKSGIFAGETPESAEAELPVELAKETAEKIVAVVDRLDELELGDSAEQEAIAWIFLDAAVKLAELVAPEEPIASWRWSRPLERAFTGGELYPLLLDRELELSELLADPGVKNFLEVHEHGGTIWFRKERFESLVHALAVVDAVESESPAAPRDHAQSIELASKSGYRFLELLRLCKAARLAAEEESDSKR